MDQRFIPPEYIDFSLLGNTLWSIFRPPWATNEPREGNTMENKWILSLLLMSASVLAGPLAFAHNAHPPGFYHLEFANGAVHAHCQFTQGPQTPDESKMTIMWMNGATGTAAEPPGTFAVDLFMPGMGHGSSPTQVQHVLDKDGSTVVGAYEISNMYFVMAGKWQVNVTLNSTDGTKETKTIDLDVPGSMMHH
jgi:hypothetical protein